MLFYLRLVRTALRSLDSHFLRSLLATLGVLIGVSSVVACMSILEGASNDILNRFKTLGSNVLYVFPKEARVEGRIVGVAQTLDLADLDTLRRELPTAIDRVAPEAFGSATLKHFQKSTDATLLATSNEYFEIHDYKPASGKVFSAADSANGDASVIVLGSNVADELFGGAAAVGQRLKVGGVSYRIVAVMEKRGSLAFLNADDSVFIPIQTGLKRFFNRKWLNRMTVSLHTTADIDEVQKQVQRVLRREHHVRIGDEDDFTIFNQQEALQNVNGAMLVFKIVFYSIAGISLIVGGIGIMNIMLVSVTERTREIGVRIAVGARSLDILLQFLFESLVISFVGGGLGLLLGTMFADVMEKVLVQMNFQTAITPTIIVTSLLTATFVGVASGIYPAYKASRLDPVVALRYE